MSGYGAILPPLRLVLDAAREAGVPVTWLMARYEEALIPPSMLAQRRRLGVSAVCCAAGTWGADFFGVAPAPGEPVFEKSTYSGFSNPELDRFLRARRIEALAFCGVQTNVCVESTLREAHSRGYDVAIVRDAVASHTATLHEATLANVGFLFGELIGSGDLARSWDRRQPAAA